MQRYHGKRNLGFSDDEVKVHCSTFGGATLQPGDPNRSILNLLSRGLTHRPSVIYLHIGENDLRSMTPEQISGAISALSFYVSSVCPSVRVFLCSELFAFPTFKEQFVVADPQSVVSPVNTSLSTAIEVRSIAPLPGSMIVKFWQHQIGQKEGETHLYLPDRVHLNDVGMERYWHSVRAAIGFALSRL